MANHNLKIIYYFFLSLLLIPVVGTSALTKDSLLLKLATSKEDTTTIKILNALSRELIKSNPSKAIIYGKQSLQLARTINNSAGIGDVLEILGLIYNEQSSFDSSEYYFKEAIKGYSSLATGQKSKEEKSMLLKLSKCYYNIATLYFNRGKYDLALEYSFKSKNIEERFQTANGAAIALKQISCCYQLIGKYAQAVDCALQALRIFEKNNDFKMVSSSYNDIGSFYTEQKDYSRALDCFFKALEINIENKSEETSPDIYTNIGSALLNSGKSEESLKYYMKALDLYNRQRNDRGISTVYSNLAYAFKNLNRYSESIEYNIKAVDLMKKIGFKMGYTYTYCNISELYNLTGNYGKSIEYGEEALRLSKEAKILYIEEQANLTLSVAYQKLQKPERALDYFKKYSFLKDSLLNIEKQKQITEMQVRYETETLEKQKQIAEQESELLKAKASRERIWVRFMLLVTLITTIFVIVLLIQIKNQKRLNGILVIKNREVVKSERMLYEKKKELEEVIDLLKDQNGINKNIYVEKYSQSSLQKTEEKLFIERLERLMVEDKLFLQGDLSLDKLAKQLDSNRSYISQIINDNYKQNFSSFLNQYRVKEACYLLSDPKSQVKTIEGIAKEVGFNSITTFNRCFKKHTGVNPSFYIKTLPYNV